MLANVAAFAFTVALTAVGIWLAMSIADLRKTQDCVLMGRRDCVAHFHAAFLAFLERSGQAGLFGPQIRARPALPASIELKAALRYTGTQLRTADGAFRGAAPACRAILEFIFNISKA